MRQDPQPVPLGSILGLGLGDEHDGDSIADRIDDAASGAPKARGLGSPLEARAALGTNEDLEQPVLGLNRREFLLSEVGTIQS